MTTAITPEWNSKPKFGTIVTMDKKFTKIEPSKKPGPEDTQQVVTEPENVEYTKEEVEEIRETAKKLMGDAKKADPTVINVAMTMLASRQMYMAALYDMEERLRELEVSNRDGVRQTIADAMQYQAQQPFVRSELLDKIQMHVIPYFVATVQSEKGEEERREKERARLEDEERRERHIPIGFPIVQDLPEDAKEMERERTLILAGHPGAVKFLLRRAVETALLQKATSKVPKLKVLHLSCYDKGYRNKTKRPNQDKTHIVIEERVWKYQLTGAQAWTKFIFPWQRQMRKQSIDLLVVDDITQLMEPRMATVPPGKVAAQAHRHLRRWADAAGCAVLCGYPVEEQDGKLGLLEDAGPME